MAAPILPWISAQFFDANGDPLSGGKVFAYVAGTTTAQDTYEDSDLVTPNPNPIILGADGRPPDPIFLLATGYKFIVKTSADVTLWTIDNVSDPGYIFAETYGTLQTAGGKNQLTGYQVLDTDRLVTMTAGGTVNLLPADEFSGILALKNLSTSTTMVVTPDGSDTIEGTAGAYTVAASTATLKRTVLLASDGVSAWWILSGLGV
jgi:hypothetical protein